MLKSKIELPIAAKGLLLSVFITNVGNGMHTLAIGKLLYDKTGSITAFGAVFILEYIINFMVQIIAGPFVDRGNAKNISVTTDLLRGATILLSTLFIYLNPVSLIWITLSVFAINIGKPFYRSATFSLGPSLLNGKGLLKFNAFYDSLQQGGQLIGLAIAGVLINSWGPLLPFAFNGLSYIFAALVVAILPLPISPRPKYPSQFKIKTVLTDWLEIINLVRADITLLMHIMFTALDVLAVTLLELALIPLVNQRTAGNALWLSAYNGAFAVGAILGAFLVTPMLHRHGKIPLVKIGMLGQVICFALLALISAPILNLLTILALGIVNSFSFSCFVSALQERSRGPIKGRIVATRNFITSLLATLMIPLVTSVLNVSPTKALTLIGALIFVFALAFFYLSNEKRYGIALLGKVTL